MEEKINIIGKSFIDGRENEGIFNLVDGENI